MKAELLSIEEIHPAPDNLRHRATAPKELVASILAVGILQPLVVRTNDEGYEVIAGHRRLDAARKAGLTVVPVVIRDDLVDDRKVEAMIVENFHREDLSAIEQAEGLFRLSELGLDRKEIAGKTGLSAKLVGERVKLLDLPEKAQQAIHQGQLSIDAGLLLAKEATDPELVTQVVEDILTGDGRGSIEQRLDSVKRARENQDQFQKLSEKAAKLHDKGIEVIVVPVEDQPGYYGWQTPRGWQAVGADRYDQIDLDAKVHAKEECAVFVLVEPKNEFVSVIFRQFCKKPARHTFTGASELKIPKAEETAKDKTRVKEARARDREKAQVRKARYQAALQGKAPRSLTYPVAVRLLIENTWAEHVKEAARLLDLEPGDRQGSADWQTPLTELAKTQPDKVVLALAFVDTNPLDPGYRASRLGDELLARLVEQIPEGGIEK